MSSKRVEKNPSGEVKSLSVVKRSSDGGAPVAFEELAQETNLNAPPHNWLLGKQAEKEPWVPRKSKTAGFNSFLMGNNFVDTVGEVDVISDAENMKKLLTMTLEESPQVSLVVHRIGKTLMLDSFDTFRQMLRLQEEDYQWIRELVTLMKEEESVAKGMKPAVLPKNEVQEKVMMSKFLYHSIKDQDVEVRSEMASTSMSDEDQSQLSLVVPDPLDGEEAWKAEPRHERTSLWTFEDIRMLVGTDLPIFGRGRHPCVTLKLKDMKKPINVLTGIDYWLDQLMCNVPEVVMCYHLDGIVQKYEIIPTEQLPNISGSQFSPELVKGVAQNIISFLKNNATKEGHTYWLFKGEDDEVVKLYDLSSLCQNLLSQTANANPFTLPVAVLMYRVAKNLMQQSENAPRQRANTIYRLLHNCLELLDAALYPQVVGSVHYLLANLYLSYGANGGPKSKKTDLEEPPTGLEDWEPEESWEPTKTGETSSCVSIDVLNRTETPGVGGCPKTVSTRPLPNSTNLDDCCKEALEHIYQGIRCSQTAGPNDAEMAEDSESVMGRSELSPVRRRSKSLSSGVLPHVVRTPASTPWQMELRGLLLIQSATAYRLLAECSLSLSHFGRALKYSRLGFTCLESVKTLSNTIDSSGVQSRIARKSKEVSRELIPSFLALCGNTYGMLAHSSDSDRPRQAAEFNGKLHYRDFTIMQLARTILGVTTDTKVPFAWAASNLPVGLEKTFSLGLECYEASLKEMKKFSRNHSASRYLRFIAAPHMDQNTVKKNMGNLKNEMGSFYSRLLSEYVKEGEFRRCDSLENAPSEPNELIQHLVREGEKKFVEGMKVFEEVGDDSNQALLLSNAGRLFRLQAYWELRRSKEFSGKERVLFEKAISYYNRGLERVTPEMGDKVWETVLAEFASTFQTLAVQLQERPPLSTHTKEEIQREIADVIQKSLRQYEMLADLYKGTSLAIHAMIKAVDMNYRLGSMYHHVFRQKDDLNSKKTKLIKNQADLHYSKAVEMYQGAVGCSPSCRTISRSIDLIRIQIERVSLSEFAILSSPTVFPVPVKERLYSQMLQWLGPECEQEWEFIDENVQSLIQQSTINKEKHLEEGETEDLLTELKDHADLFLNRCQAAAKCLLLISTSDPISKKLSPKEVTQRKALYKATLQQLPEDHKGMIAAVSSVSRSISRILSGKESLK